RVPVGDDRLRRRAVELDGHLEEAAHRAEAAPFEQAGRASVPGEDVVLQPRGTGLAGASLDRLDERRAEPAAPRVGIDHADTVAEIGAAVEPAGGNGASVLLGDPGVPGEVDAAHP